MARVASSAIMRGKTFERRFTVSDGGGGTVSGERPIPVWPGLVSTGIDPMHRGPASLEGQVF